MRSLLWTVPALVGIGACSVLNAPDDVTPPVTHASGGGGQGGAASCASDEELCGDTCVDLQTDPEHCGSCDSACNADQTCYNGQCRCPANTTECGGDCADFQSDPRHCGGCDNACEAPLNADPTCAQATCGWECSEGYEDCNGEEPDGCEVATGTDPEHCGDCDTVCDPVDHGQPGCSDGSCGIANCDVDYDDCDGDTDTGCETALRTSFDHCGACNDPCQAGQSCIAGNCENSVGSCLEILQSDPNAPNGDYAIDPDGPGGAGPFDVYCDMSAGGHTVYGVTHDWGEWGSNMTIVIRDRLTPAVGNAADWDATCAALGTTKYAGGWQNNGGTYSLPQFQVYADAGAWWTSYATQVFPTVTYNDILILHDALSPDCWAHYAEPDSLGCFGSVAGSGYSFCRQGASASKRYHIYLCL